MAIWLACLGAQQRSAGASGTYEMPLSYVHANQSTGEIKEILRGRVPRSLTLADITMEHDAIDYERARTIFSEYGVLFVRGLNRAHAKHISQDADAIFRAALEMAAEGELTEVINDKHHVITWDLNHKAP